MISKTYNSDIIIIAEENRKVNRPVIWKGDKIMGILSCLFGVALIVAASMWENMWI